MAEPGTKTVFWIAYLDCEGPSCPCNPPHAANACAPLYPSNSSNFHGPRQFNDNWPRRASEAPQRGPTRTADHESGHCLLFHSASWHEPQSRKWWSHRNLRRARFSQPIIISVPALGGAYSIGVQSPARRSKSRPRFQVSLELIPYEFSLIVIQILHQPCATLQLPLFLLWKYTMAVEVLGF